jgi:hypothetical protein
MPKALNTTAPMNVLSRIGEDHIPVMVVKDTILLPPLQEVIEILFELGDGVRNLHHLPTPAPWGTPGRVPNTRHPR